MSLGIVLCMHNQVSLTFFVPCSDDLKFEDDPDKDLARALTKTTGNAIPESLSAKNEKKFCDDSVQWLCQNDPERPGTHDDSTSETIAGLTGVPFKGHPVFSKEKVEDHTRRSQQGTADLRTGAVSDSDCDKREGCLGGWTEFRARIQ